MFGGIDMKQMQGMMRKMGISQEEIRASRVVIECENKNIVIHSPQIVRVKMSGQESFQISGDISEENILSQKETKEAELKDIIQVMEKTGKTRLEAEVALKEADGDLAEAILSLS